METTLKIVKSPYRFEPWTLSITDNVKYFNAWWKSLAQENPIGLGAIGWVIASPILSIMSFFVAPWYWKTFVFMIVNFLITAWCLMLSYHRMLSHKSFKVHPWVKAVMLIVSTTAMEGPALGWVRNHRAHHRHLDTERDPYDAKKGFWWSHMGWALHPYDPSAFADIDVSDLTSDPQVMLQEQWYMPLAMSLGFIFPTLFCGLAWGDYAGGFWFGGILRTGICLQTAFFVNSLAHYQGEHTYTENTTPVDNLLVQIVTTGEGFHNFHHAFPYDYRGTSDPLAIDPLKWLTYLLYLLGLASELKRYPDKLINHAKLETSKKRIERELVDCAPCKADNLLPPMSTADVKRRVDEGAQLIIVKGHVHDVHEFLSEHPGGEAILKSYIGKDATKAFYGNLVQHTPGAQELLASLTVAKIVDSKSD